MGAVTFSHTGDFKKTERFLNFLLKKDYLNVLDKYGQMGVEALRAATPVNTGLVASSWDYRIENTSDGITKLIWINTDIEGGVNIAVLIDKGHATKSGSWVEGKHYIADAIDPIITELKREVTTFE